MISNAGAMTAPKHLALTMLSLTLVVQPDPMIPDSIAFTFDTWTTGPTKALALSAWKNAHKMLAEHLTAVAVVTPGPKPAEEIPDPWIPRLGKPRGVYASRRVA